MSNRHPVLNYDLDAPLPYMLTDEELYGKFEVREEEYSDYGKDSIMHYAETFANFLNESSSYGPHGSIPTIDETIFVKSFLPHFYSEEVVDKKVEWGERDGGVIETWVKGVAGGVYNAVNVTREGKVIYRVPPTSGQLRAIGPTARGDRSVRVMLKEAADMYLRLPQTRDRQLKFALDESMGGFDPNTGRHTFMSLPNLKFIFVLDEIFTYYGYDSILTPEIMSIKPQVFGEDYVNRRTRGSVSSTNSNRVEAGPIIEDDSDLFG